MSLSLHTFGITRGSCLSAAIDCNARAACVGEKSSESSTLAADTEVGLWRARDIRRKRLWLRRNTRRGQSKVGPRAIEGRVERARRAKFLPCQVDAVHNDAEPFGVDEIYERLDHRLSRSHRAAARGGFAPTAKRRLGRVRTPAHSNGNIPRPPRELRPREINRHESTAGA